MLRPAVILSFILIATLSTAQIVSLNLARETYFGIETDECNALRLSDNFANNPPKTALLLAYYGASTAAAPACLSNPAKKISYFRKGKQLLAEAVKLEPDSFEIRFLRFATQSKTPSFLGYNQHIEEDKRFLLANLSKGQKSVSNDRIFNKMIEFLVNSDKLTKAEQNSIRLSNQTTLK